MNWAEIVVYIVLVPANQQTSVGLNPVAPVVLVWISCLELKSNFDSSRRCRVRLVVEELTWIRITDNAVWTRVTWLGTPPSNVVEFGSESILDTVVQALALQVSPVSEKNDH
ncbi:hypothetical protein [Natrinema sp. 74]|uniref:hypothetical protein n=1 Tax=Natrinema sp. 74 TaxID=3384159 RepID=UPI0038D4437B